MKIYNELESLGFFEWLKEKGFGSGFTAMILDAQPFDSIERSGYNAIAFRWFREKYNLIPNVESIYTDETRTEIKFWFWIGNHKEYSDDEVFYDTYEEAELECLVKLIEIVKNK